MAKFNEILSGRFNRAIQKLTSIKGGPPAAQLATEIAPQLSFPLGAEFRILESWFLWAALFNAPANGAGNKSGFQLRNPSGSNVIVVVSQVLATATANDIPTLGLGPQPSDLDTAVTSRRFDNRVINQQPNAIATLRGNGTTFLGINPFAQIGILANTTAAFIVDSGQEIVVLPGDCINLVSNNLNQAITGSIWWRERFLEDSERTA